VAKPDGYTIGFLNTPSFLQKPYERKTRYTKDSFTYIANLVYDPGMFAVLADSDIKTLKDLVETARKAPKQITVSTAGIGTDDHLTLTRFQALTGTEITMVPFAGDNPAMTALLGGHTRMSSMNIGAFGSWLQEGKIRGLAIASEAQDPLAPGVPTFREQGIDLIAGSARGMAGPAGMPEEVVQQLSAAMAKAVADPEFVEASRKQFVVLKYMDGAEYRKFVDAQDAMVKEQWEKDPWVKKQ
jgi:tripartite-type tricarboxylate transporter receptor subunit TctC